MSAEHSMSEVQDRAEAQAPVHNQVHEVSAGTLLRRAREAAGLHVETVAVSLKVPVPKLEALEEDRFDQMPDIVFVRGLASSVCRVLKIDPQPVLDRLPQSTAPRLIRDIDGLNTPFRAPGDAAPPGWIDHARQPVFLAVFALLLGALILILLPHAHKDDRPTQPAVATNPETAMAIEPAPQQQYAAPPAAAASEAVPVPALSGASSPAAVAPVGVPSAASLSAAPVPASPATVVPAPKSVASAASLSAPATVPVAEAAADAGLVVIRAKGETWVDVTDAKGATAVRKMLVAGDSVGASGAVPLHVTIGRAHATEVLVRGKPFDMRSVSRDDVARFEVK